MGSGESATHRIRRAADDSERRGATTDDLFEVLGNERRRAVLRYLNAHGGAADLSDVAEHLAAAENDTTVQRLSSQQRKRVRIALYQCHLPKMDSLELIEYDKSRGTIELRVPASEVEPFLELDRTDAREGASSSRRVTALAVGVAVLVTAGTFGLGPLSAIPPAWWTLLSALAVAGLAGREYRADRRTAGRRSRPK